MSDPLGDWLTRYEQYLNGEIDYDDLHLQDYLSYRVYSVETLPGGSTLTSIGLSDRERDGLTIRSREPRSPLPVARLLPPRR